MAMATLAIEGANAGIVRTDKTTVTIYEVIEHTLEKGAHSTGEIEVHVRIDHRNGNIQIATVQDDVRLIGLREGTIGTLGKIQEVDSRLSGDRGAMRTYEANGNNRTDHCVDDICVEALAEFAERVARGATLNNAMAQTRPGTVYARMCATETGVGERNAKLLTGIGTDCMWRATAGDETTMGRRMVTANERTYMVNVAAVAPYH